MTAKQQTTAALNAVFDDATWDDLETLVPADEPRFSPEQIVELNRRLADFDSGKERGIPGDEVLRRIEERLARRTRSVGARGT